MEWQPISATVAAAPDVLLVELPTWIQNSDAHSAAAHMTAEANLLDPVFQQVVVLPLARLCLLRQLLMFSSGAPFEHCLPVPLLLTQLSRIRASGALGTSSHLSSSGDLIAALHILGPPEKPKRKFKQLSGNSLKLWVASEELIVILQHLVIESNRY